MEQQTTQTVTPEEAERQIRLLAAVTSGDRASIEWAAQEIARRSYERAMARYAALQGSATGFNGRNANRIGV